MAAPDFKALTAAHEEEIIAFRRDLHENPEISGEGIRTTGRIKEELDKLGIPYVMDAKRNVIGKLVGAKPGKKIAIRGDFDALPTTEATGLPFSSKVEGKAHLCGHDGHAAGLLGAAKVLAPMRDSLSGTVYFCFQMGDETSEGAPEIVEYLEKEGGVDLAIAVHLMPGFPPGTFICSPGPMMAGAATWEVVVKGKGGHGSTPWLAIDPIKPACEILLRLVGLTATKFNPFDTFIVSPCKITGGTADNIVPVSAEITGTLRFFKPEQLKEIPAAMEQIAVDIASSYGATAEFRVKNSCMPVINDAGAVQMAQKVSADLGFPMYPMYPPATGSDNFGEFLHKFKGFYFYSGVTRPGAPLVINHNPNFDIDEEAMIDDTVFLSAFAYRFLNGELGE